MRSCGSCGAADVLCIGADGLDDGGADELVRRAPRGKGARDQGHRTDRVSAHRSGRRGPFSPIPHLARFSPLSHQHPPRTHIYTSYLLLQSPPSAPPIETNEL